MSAVLKFNPDALKTFEFEGIIISENYIFKNKLILILSGFNCNVIKNLLKVHFAIW